ncbi:hypothetical protein QE152_g22097 [Popillia japonica]|uniref:Uncharacterized protein n=1 Tax=Popillia japonica TaxID=7064 RepID=A0AAW1KLU1_POPJA
MMSATTFQCLLIRNDSIPVHLPASSDGGALKIPRNLELRINCFPILSHVQLGKRCRPAGRQRTCNWRTFDIIKLNPLLLSFGVPVLFPRISDGGDRSSVVIMRDERIVISDGGDRSSVVIMRDERIVIRRWKGITTQRCECCLRHLLSRNLIK